MISRQTIAHLHKSLHRNKVLIVFGPRQVGKTTLMKELIKQMNQPYLFFNADDFDVKEMFERPSITRLKSIVGDHNLLVIDEAQRIENIGLVLKLFKDELPHVQVIASGSSAFELSDKVKEPLTGRSVEFKLFPLSWREMVQHTSVLTEHSALNLRLLYGYYPEVVNNQGREREVLAGLAGNYLYRDILSLENVRKPYLLDPLLKAIAAQTGNEVSYNKIANHIRADVKTVEHYIDLLEKSFIIFRLPAFNRNVFSELKKGMKIYFWDVGIRNAVLGNFTPIETRTDIGALWENFLLVERMKKNVYGGKTSVPYFWRTTYQTEIDYLEVEHEGIDAFEFKWNKSNRKNPPGNFTQGYPEASYRIITRENYMEWLIQE